MKVGSFISNRIVNSSSSVETTSIGTILTNKSKQSNVLDRSNLILSPSEPDSEALQSAPGPTVAKVPMPPKGRAFCITKSCDPCESKTAHRILPHTQEENRPDRTHNFPPAKRKVRTSSASCEPPCEDLWTFESPNDICNYSFSRHICNVACGPDDAHWKT